MGAFELDGKALFWNRLLALGLAGLFAALAVRAFARRQADALRLAGRLRSLPRAALALVPWAILPLNAAYAQRCVELGCRMLSVGLDVWTLQRGLKVIDGEYAGVLGEVKKA